MCFQEGFGVASAHRAKGECVALERGSFIDRERTTPLQEHIRFRARLNTGRE